MADGGALLMFGDSSGNPSMSRGGFVDSRHFIVGTMTMGAGEAHRINEAVLGLKKSYLPKADPLRVEFHGSALRKRLNLYTGNRAHSEKMFRDIVGDLVNVVVDSRAFVNMVVMDKIRPVETAGHVGVMSRSWAHAADMFRQNLLHSKSGAVGIAILDRYDYAENRIVSRAIEKSLGQLNALVKDTNCKAVPHPILVDSRSSNIVQLVDIITYVVARHAGNKNDTTFVKMYRRLLPSIDRIINLTPKLA